MDAQVRNNTAASRYELVIDSQVVGVADYFVAGPKVVFPHTEIAPPLQGRGLGAKLVQGALDDVRKSGRVIVPQCWYVAQFVDDHPEYADLLAA